MEEGPRIGLHYAPNHNFDMRGDYLPGKFGFNLIDTGPENQRAALKTGAKELVWVGQCNGIDESFLRIVRPFIGRSNVLGFFLMDDPDPRGVSEGNLRRPQCKADELKAESDWIHANFRRARTFIVLMNMSTTSEPSFPEEYNPTHTHVDLFGIDPYPCRTELNGCDFGMIDRYVRAADAAGIPRNSMVPVYQAFGGGDWVDDSQGQYILPTIAQECQILDHWHRLLDAPVFDMSYSWGVQRGDAALENAPPLREFFRRWNHLGSAACTSSVSR